MTGHAKVKCSDSTLENRYSLNDGILSRIAARNSVQTAVFGILQLIQVASREQERGGVIIIRQSFEAAEVDQAERR